MGNRVFWKSQYAKETFASKGTPVAATKIWPGSISVPDDIAPLYPDHNLGNRVKNMESALMQYLVDGITLADPQAAFSSLLLPLATTLKGNFSPTEQNPTKNDYLWDFSPGMTTTGDTLDAATLEYGDDDQAYRSEYFIGRRVLIKGAVGQNQGVSVECEGFARQVSKNAFTGALVPSAWTLMNPNTCQLWMDTTFAGAGTTEQTNLLRDFEIEILTGTHPKFLGNSLTFNKHGNGYVAVMFRLTVEGGASAVAFWDLARTRAKRAFQLKMTGPLIASGGAAYSATFVLWGDVMVSPLAGDQDGNTIYKLAVTGLYDSVSSSMLSAKVSTLGNTI